MIGISLGILAIYFVAGLGVLIFGATQFVKGSAALATRLGVPKFVVGSVVMALATTSPELVVSYTAAVNNQVWLAIGNVLGSYITNIGLVLGLTGLLRPIVVSYNVLHRQLPFCVAALSLLVLVSMKAYVFWVDAFMLLILLVPWLIWVLMQQDRSEDVGQNVPAMWWIFLKLAIGVAALYGGSQLLVAASEAMAFNFGVSTYAIGLTMVAVSTSLPELGAGIVSAYMGEFDLLMGNIVGANILLILLVLPVTVMSANSPVVLSTVWGEYLFMALLSMLLWLFSTYFDEDCRISRYEAGVLLVVFVIYQLFVFK